MSNEKLGLFLTLISAAAFGTMAIFAKFAYSLNLNIVTILIFRFSIASIVLWLYLYSKNILAPVAKETVFQLIITGIFGYSMVSLGYFTCVKLASASLAGILLYLHPSLVYIVLLFLNRESFAWNKMTALILSFIGLIFILKTTSDLFNIWGIIAGLMSAVAYTFYVVTGDKAMQKVPPLQGTAIIISSSAIFYLILGIFKQEIILPHTIYAYNLMFLIAIISTLIAIAFFWLGAEKIGPSKATIISTTEPLITVTLAYIFLGEKLSPVQSFGGILIILSIFILRSKK